MTRRQRWVREREIFYTDITSRISNKQQKIGVHYYPGKPTKPKPIVGKSGIEELTDTAIMVSQIERDGNYYPVFTMYYYQSRFVAGFIYALAKREKVTEEGALVKYDDLILFASTQSKRKMAETIDFIEIGLDQIQKAISESCLPLIDEIRLR